MSGPVLVVDFGTSSSAAAVVLDGRERLVKEPSSGLLSWPSAVCAVDGRLVVGSAAERRKRVEPESYRSEFKRDLGQRSPMVLGGSTVTSVALVAAVLREFKAQAEILVCVPVERLVATVPASYGRADPRRDAMLEAGRAAGFRGVELLSEPVAAAYAAVAGEPLDAGSTVLVYDFGGGTFDTALIRIGSDGVHTTVGHAALDDCGGRDIDGLLAGRIRERGHQWLEPLLHADGSGALRAKVELDDFVRRVKHQLSESPEVEDYLTPLTPASHVARRELEELVAPLLQRTIACCRALLDDHGVKLNDVDCVLLVGGTTRVPAVRALLTEHFKRPLRLVEDPDLAVVHGAAAWAARAAERRLLPVATEADVVPLAWSLNDQAELDAWHVPEGSSYESDQTLGVLRTTGGALLELAAARPGTVVRCLRSPGDAVTSGDWLVAVRHSGDAPARRAGAAGGRAAHADASQASAQGHAAAVSANPD